MPKKLPAPPDIASAEWPAVVALVNAIIARRKISFRVFADEVGARYDEAYKWIRSRKREPLRKNSLPIIRWCKKYYAA